MLPYFNSTIVIYNVICYGQAIAFCISLFHNIYDNKNKEILSRLQKIHKIKPYSIYIILFICLYDY